MDKHFKRGFVFGGIVGSVLALFAASEKGKELRGEMREDLEAMYEELKERAIELSALTRENFDRAVESVVGRKTMPGKIKDRVTEELKRRYHDIQLYYLYSKIRSRLHAEADVTRQDFEEAVNELVDEFAENKEIAVSKLREMKRQLRSMWSEFKKDLDESDEG